MTAYHSDARALTALASVRPGWMIHGLLVRRLLVNRHVNDTTSLTLLSVRPDAACPLTDLARAGWLLYAPLLEATDHAV